MTDAFPELHADVGTGEVMAPAEVVALLLCSEVDTDTPVASFQRCARAWMASTNATASAAVQHFAAGYAQAWESHCPNTTASLDAFLAPYRAN